MLIEGDWIACQITSNPYADPWAIMLENDAFAEGGLQRISYVRPGKLFTANESLVAVSCGSLNAQALTRVRDVVVASLREFHSAAPRAGRAGGDGVLAECLT